MMFKIIQIAIRNLARYKRRNILTGLLIALGVAAVIIFGGLGGSFKQLMIGQITDSMLGHMQIHKKGYVSSIENLPLDRNLPPKAYQKLVSVLEEDTEILSYAPRLKLGAMLSNYEATTNIRLNGIYPEKEMAVVPDLFSRVREGVSSVSLLDPGEILIPELLSKGMQLKTGDTVVIVAHNKDGSVNGLTLKVAGMMESVTGPGGKDGYIHIQDAMKLLRMPQPEISEVAIRINGFERLKETSKRMDDRLASIKNKKDQPLFEVHSWDQLSPFSNIAGMIDMMSFFIKIILVAVVLVSILNIMIMSVYERVREIGTIAAMGTTPSRILWLFLTEGLTLGVMGSVVGSILGSLVIWIVNFSGFEFTFGRGKVYQLFPSVQFEQVVYVCFTVIIISAFASLQPSLKAARLEPVNALRHV